MSSHGVVVQQAAREAGRPAPEIVPQIVPRSPVRFEGAEEQTMTAGNLRMLHGTPDGMVEQLAAYQRAGANEVVILFGSLAGGFVVEQMELFQREVMPAFID